MVARFFPTSWFFLVVITSHFIGARADLYPIELKEDQQLAEQLDLKSPCFISLSRDTWQCGASTEKPNRGLVVKRSGQLAVFTNRFTGWLKKIKAAHVIYPGEGVKMVEEGKRVVFKHVDSHKEAAVKLSNEVEDRKLSFSQREFQASGRTHIADRWYIASCLSTSWQLGSSSARCRDGVALISNRKGKLEWKVFGFWSRGMKKKAVAGICPGEGVRVSKEGSAAVFTHRPQTSTVWRKMLLIPTQVDIGSYYVPYHIDSVDHVRPGIVKVPADQTCSLENDGEGWVCKTVEKLRGRPKGLMLNVESGNRQRGVFKYSRLSRFGTNRYAAFIVPGAGGTVDQSRSGYLTFHHGQHAAVFPLGDIFGLMAARDNDPVAIAFARGEIDDDSAVTLSIEPTDVADASAPAKKLTIRSPIGVISYENQQWKYTESPSPPSSAEPQGLAIHKSIDSMLSAEVYIFQTHPLSDAIAAVFAGNGVKMTHEAGGTRIVHQATRATGWIAKRQARKVPKGYMYAGAEVPYKIKYTSREVTTEPGPQFHSVLQPAPVLGSLAVYELSFSDNAAWQLSPSSSDSLSPHDAPFLALEALAGPFDDRAIVQLTARRYGPLSPETIAIIKAEKNGASGVMATTDGPFGSHVQFIATGWDIGQSKSDPGILYSVHIQNERQLTVQLKVPPVAE